ncbi:pyruvate, water dikinase regulatory protein [Fundicoccus culcitae]|uniref:Putative pyruvate, phosphate dikinase regulatory protein n=1 Tax=Fundicoccus culcitae TaxID=2969821 RepID=A0ABY5P7J0_9LACT|nr:pyruvate, water dikinase regulatory protein [Fundicoccus culcitae]UUX34350.1 kinase/pyrophosphorylase [Fundicoccus culcitae]
MKEQPTLHYYILSDSIGETAQKVANAAIAQFPDANTVLHKYIFISNIEDLDKILNEAVEIDGLIFMTIANAVMANYVERFCIKTGLICYNLIQPFTLEIQRRLGIQASWKVGAQHELSEDYFKRVNAMEFCIAYDDGKDPSAIKEADIVLLGISRTSKTPLSMYLAMNGFKVVNIPLIPEKELPEEIYQVSSKKIIGLTNDATVINRHREIRMESYGVSQSRYSSMDRVNVELEYANQIYAELGCYVINVSERSIEETAGLIMQQLQVWN